MVIHPKIGIRQLFVLGTCLLYAGCSTNGPRGASSGGAAPSATAAAPAWSPSNWSDAERLEYYHLPEGSEFMPYALVANVVSVKTNKPFLQNMERFGFVADAVSATNPHGLPIGMTAVRSRNAKHAGLEMIGFNCAACHVGEMTYRGKALIVDGAPSLIDLEAYQVEFKTSFDAAIHDPKKFLALIVAFNREISAKDTQASDDANKYASDPALKVNGEIPATSTADTSFHSVPPKTADAADPGSAVRGQSFLQRIQYEIALVKAKVAYFNDSKLLLNGTEPGPGRIDAFGAARTLLFPKSALPMESPVSFPFIWDVPDTTQQRSANDAVWIHYDGNTNSILERNIGQALGMGALFDPQTYESTLRIRNLHRLEVLTHKLAPPKWPVELFGPVDSEKAKAGEAIFAANCAGCHQNRLYPLNEVGTDPHRAESFGQPVSAGQPFPNAVQPILDHLKLRAFADEGVTAEEQLTMDANPAIWRATGQYLARPLSGVWATAPYLHNGSVPTLWDLLHPDQRPAKFVAGNREYDPRKVGYVTTGSGWTFDASQPGNANTGHVGDKYGTNLTEPQKQALLEFLKTL